MTSLARKPAFLPGRLRTAFGIIASFLLVATLVTMFNSGERHDGPAFVQATDAATTDSLRFRSQLRAAEKPLAAVGQWAYADANGAVAQRGYSTNTQTRVQNGGACAYGGSGASCRGQAARSDASVNHRPDDWVGNFGSTRPAIYVNFLANFTAEVRCQADGSLTAIRPGGIVQYGNDSYFTGAHGFRSVNVANVANNTTFDDNFRAVGNWVAPDTYIRVQATPSWGTNTLQRRAWSEVTVNLTATSNSTQSTSVTYRTECGVQMNDNRGSTGPRSAGFAAAAGADLEPRTTVTVEEDGEETVIEVDPDTGEPLTDVPAADAPVGEPHAGGFTVESELQDESLDYHVLATRELSEDDLDTVRDALGAATAPEARSRTGDVDGGRWTLFSGDGEHRDLPVVEVELSDGAIVQVRPLLDGAQLPSAELEEGQR